ncbi:MAG: tetratricopeptide repeat protein, partial [Lysobacterales bacterium]
ADDLFFTEGVHDDLLTQLANISSLVVISRTSVMQYRDSGKTVPEIAKELGVATILECGIQRAGDRVRINLQLIDAATDKHLWAETYDRELSAENVFAIQSEIATSIADVLHAKLLPGEQARIDAIPTRSLEAYDAYLLGRRALATRRREGFVEAEAYFSRAIELDPAFALAYSGLADAFTLHAVYGADNAGELFAEGEQAARKALELNTQLGEAHTSFGIVRRLNGGTPQEYVPYLERGIALAPGSADARKWYANYLSESNRNEEALVQLQKAVELDPMSAIIRVTFGNLLEELGREDDARAAYQRALEIDPSFDPALASLRAISTLDQGLVEYSKVSASRNANPWIILELVLSYLELTDDARAEQWVTQIERTAPESIPALISRMNLGLYRGQQADALGFAAELLKFEAPDTPIPSRILALHDLRRGNPEAARLRYAEKYPALLGDGPQVGGHYEAAIDVALLLKALGEAGKANRLLDRSLENIPTVTNADRRAVGVMKARAYALKNDRDAALGELQAAIDAGWRDHWWFFLEQDAAFDSLRDEPRYKALMDKIRTDVAKQLALVRQHEASGEIALPPVTQTSSGLGNR